jgi:hypothetical protein
MSTTFADSRLGPGTLQLGTAEYGQQITNVVLTPSLDSTDGTPTLADPDPLPDQKETWALEGSAIQDFELATGFVNYCFDNSGTSVPFTWTPNTDAGVVYSGTVLLSAVPIGGDAGVQVTADFSFPVDGKPTRVDGAPLSSSAKAKASA